MIEGRAHRYSRAGDEWIGWGASFAVVLGLHGAIGLAALGWQVTAEPYTPPPAAVMIDLAPVVTAPATTPTEIPPGPQQVQAAPPPPEPEPEPEPPKMEPTPSVEKPAVALPPPKPKLKPPPKPMSKIEPLLEPEPAPRPPAPATTAPQAAPVEAEVAAAPRPGASSLPPSNALPTWRGALLGHLERLKRYPPEAQWRRQQGVVYLRITMDRTGRVLHASIEKSAGVASLDAEVMALIERAQPLPPPPADVPGDPLELIVPVQFFMRGRP